METSLAKPEDAAQTSRTKAEGAERLYTIGDMARLYSVTLRALRFYEDRGLITPIRQGVSRYYDSAARARLETILRGKRLGFTLGQIAEMVPRGDCAPLRPQLQLKEAQILSQISQLERKRDDLDIAISELRSTHSMMTSEPAEAASAA